MHRVHHRFESGDSLRSFHQHSWHFELPNVCATHPLIGPNQYRRRSADVGSDHILQPSRRSFPTARPLNIVNKQLSGAGSIAALEEIAHLVGWHYSRSIVGDSFGDCRTEFRTAGTFNDDQRPNELRPLVCKKNNLETPLGVTKQVYGTNPQCRNKCTEVIYKLSAIECRARAVPNFEVKVLPAKRKYAMTRRKSLHIPTEMSMV